MENRRNHPEYRRMELYLRSLRRLGIKLGLENISRILEAIGRPEQRYPCVLIGGTNGKGSVAAMLSAILERAGIRTGLYSSPHLLHLEERMVAGGRSIPPDTLATKILTLRDTVHSLLHTRSLKTQPTFFELTTAAALSYFSDRQVQFGILEVGMGGRFDATNVVDPEFSILTPVELDHQEFLGDTLPAIVMEKLGIFRPEGLLVTGRQHPEVQEVIRRVARERSASLLEALRMVRVVRDPSGAVSFLGSRTEVPPVQPALPGEHQLDNAATAVAACEVLADRGYRIPPGAIAEGLASVRWPGRLQLVPDQPKWLLDGAHNPAATRALAAYLKGWMGDRPPVLIFGALREKDHEGMLRALAPYCSDLILCPPPSERAACRESLADSARRVGLRGLWSGSLGEAISEAKKMTGPSGSILITGSLYLVGEALRLLEKQKTVRKPVRRPGPNPTP